MKRIRRHHRPEFTRKAVALVVEHGYSCAAAGRSLGVSGILIGRWKSELAGHRLGVRSCKAILKINESKVVDTILDSSALDEPAGDFPSFSDSLI